MNQHIILQLEQLKSHLLSEIEEIDKTIASLKKESISSKEDSGTAVPPSLGVLNTYSLSTNPLFFKGKKPCAVIFPDGRNVPAGTWKKIVEIILLDCMNHPDYKKAMLGFRDYLMGRKRKILSNTDKDMRTPIKLTDELYFESHYDTQTLLTIVITKILQPLGYRYETIQVCIQDVSKKEV